MNPSGLEKNASTAFSEIVQSLGLAESTNLDSEIVSMPPTLDNSYRSAESKAFLQRHILGSNLGSEGDDLGPLEDVDNDEDEEEDAEDTEELDMDAYTLKVRGEIIDFFATAAERINDMIDQKEAEPGGNSAKESEYDDKIEEAVQQNKKTFQKQIRPKVAEYLTLIQESIRALQAEEEELLKYCSNMYPNTCE